MEYYQKAAEAIRSGEEDTLNLLKQAGLTAVGGGVAAAGSKAVGRLLPAVGALINRYVPDKLSMAGLKKIDPRFGKFVEGALSEGYSYDDVRNFVGEKVEKTQEEEKKAPENAKTNENVVEQYDPELNTYINTKLKEGVSLFEAGQKALSHGRFKRAIDKMTKDHNSPWSAILQTVYGGKEKERSSNPQKQQPIQPQQPQQPQQGGAGQQALMAILDKINQRLGQ